jgi:hypothetical protein
VSAGGTRADDWRAAGENVGVVDSQKRALNGTTRRIAAVAAAPRTRLRIIVRR